MKPALQRCPAGPLTILVSAAMLTTQCVAPRHLSLSPTAPAVTNTAPSAVGQQRYQGLPLERWWDAYLEAQGISPSSSDSRTQHRTASFFTARSGPASPEYCRTILDSLVAFAPNSDLAVKHLVRFCYDLDEGIREAAIEDLVELGLGTGPTAKPAEEALNRLLRDHTHDVACLAAETVGDCLDDEYSEYGPNMSSSLIHAYQNALVRTVQNPGNADLERVVDYLLAVEEKAPGGIETLIHSLEQRPNLLDEDTAFSLNEAAWTLVDPDRTEPSSNLSAALLLARTAVETVPNSADLRDTLAWGLYANGRYDEALAEEEMALKMDNDLQDSLDDMRERIAQARGRKNPQGGGQ